MNDLTLYILEKNALSVKDNFLGKIYNRAIKPHILRTKNTGFSTDYNAGPKVISKLENDLLKKHSINSGGVEFLKQQASSMGMTRKEIDGLMEKQISDGLNGLIADTHNAKRMSGKIIKPKGQGIIGNLTGEDLERAKAQFGTIREAKKFLKTEPMQSRHFNVDKGTSSISNREVRNRLIDIHELNERKARSGFRKGLANGNNNAILGGHLNPDILLQDHNMLTTLDGLNKADKDNIVQSFRNTRMSTGETGFLDTIIPGGFGTGPRINKRYRKELANKVIRTLNQPTKDAIKSHNFVPNS